MPKPVTYLWEYGHSDDGNYIGAASTDKLGFFGATPVTRQASTTDIKDSLVNLGLIADSGATPLNLDGGSVTTSTLTCSSASATALSGTTITATTANLTTVNATTANITDANLANDLTITDAGNLILATSTGTQIGTATSQKLGFFGTAPATQQSLSVTTVATTQAVSTTSAIWGFSTSSQANQVIVAVAEMLELLATLGLGA